MRIQTENQLFLMDSIGRGVSTTRYFTLMVFALIFNPNIVSRVLCVLSLAPIFLKYQIKNFGMLKCHLCQTKPSQSDSRTRHIFSFQSQSTLP